MQIHERLYNVIPDEWTSKKTYPPIYNLGEGEVKVVVTCRRMIGDEEIKGSDRETPNMGGIDVVIGGRKMRYLDGERAARPEYSVQLPQYIHVIDVFQDIFGVNMRELTICEW